VNKQLKYWWTGWYELMKIKDAYCLCLDKRQKHWEELREQCESRGIKFHRFLVGKGELFPKEEYDYIDSPNPPIENWGYGREDTAPNHCNAFLSHKVMAARAIEEGLEEVLFLEDDAYFTSRYEDVLEKVSDGIDSLDWDMMYLGWWIGNEYDEWNEIIEEEYLREGSSSVGRVRAAPNPIGGLHAVIIKKKVLEVMSVLPPIGPVDSILNHNFHNGPFTINSYYVMPKIIHDKGIFSECEQSPCPRRHI
jgi:hypothetical protein